MNPMNQTMLPNMLAANPTRNLNEFNMASTPGVLLHIGNLHKEVSDAKLTEVFLKYGTVLAIRVVRDIMSKQSRGFGFVTMANQAEAEQARTHLNHERILGKEIIVSLFKKPNASDLDPRANLIIKNLDKHVGGRDLEKLCSEFGTVVTCRVKDDEEGNSIGYGYVQFEKEQEAEDCLNRIGQRLFFERLVTAERFAPLAKRNNTNQRSNLYIKHFPDNMTQNDVDSFITTHFEQFGAINSKGIYVDEKKNKIYSFVAFESPESAAKAIEQMNDHLFENGDKLYVGFAQTKVQRKQNFEKNFGRSANETNLFIRSLKSTVKDEDVKKVFSKFGPISSVATRSKEFPGTVGSFEKKVLGSAFINFLEASHASSAYKQGKTDPDVLDLLDSGVDKSIDFLFFSQPKELREQFLKTQQKKPSKPEDMTSMLSNPQFLMMFMKYMQENGNNQNQTRKPRTEGSGNSYNNYGANSSHPRRNNNRNQFNNNQTQGAPFMGQQQFGNNQMGKQMMNQQTNSLPNPMMGVNPLMMMTPFMNGYSGMNMGMPMSTVPNMQGMPMMQNMAQPQQTLNPNMAQVSQPASQTFSSKAPVVDVRWLKDNLVSFKAKSLTEQKNILGNIMYQKVVEICTDKSQVPKITGMLIDLDVLSIEEIIEILETKPLLLERIEEAQKIIEEEGQN